MFYIHVLYLSAGYAHHKYVHNIVSFSMHYITHIISKLHEKIGHAYALLVEMFLETNHSK